MASLGAALLSYRRPLRDHLPRTLVFGVMTLVAALTFLFLRGATDSTASAISASQAVTTRPESAHQAANTRGQRPDRPLPAKRRPDPTASARFPRATESWPASTSFAWVGTHPSPRGAVEIWDLRQDLAAMAMAQRRHWTPGRSSHGHGRVDSDDRIARALFGPRQVPGGTLMRPTRCRTPPLGSETGAVTAVTIDAVAIPS
ncbi:MAG: hypothetical protein K0S78_4752 [Thermomicrobiales bacterium]|nr:hypothetical protein [Thermomicrobiales bacterium]